ncbi:MAG: hypothetical protein EXQ52_12060 [Bryobacterales bacterium]|nr:hypothetical protein [Bryobacterales bacterium]
MRKVPGKPAAEFEPIQYHVARLEKIGAGVSGSFEKRSQNTPSLMGHGRAEGGGSDADEPLETPRPARIARMPRTHHEHPRGMNDRIERLVFVEPHAEAKRPVEGLCDVFYGNLVREGPVAADVDSLAVVSSIDKRLLPGLEGFALV